MRIVFWDIDGTLLTTGRAGIIAWEQAVEEVFGQRPDLSQEKTAGLTDTEIAGRLARSASSEPSQAQTLRLLRRYEAHLPACLPLRQGSVLPGVPQVLDHLRTLPDVRSLLLTGNTRAGAAAKLSHYGLARFFEDGAFSNDCVDRNEVAQRAKDLVTRGMPGAAALFVVGDTPHDIRCGKAIGAWTIAVATGEYGEDELLQHGATAVLQRLPDPGSFVRLLDDATGRAP